MPNLPVPIGGTVMTPAALTDALSAADLLADEDLAPATRRAYESDWRDFATWCRGLGLGALPAEPDTVAAYLAHLYGRGLKASTIMRRTAAITRHRSVETLRGYDRRSKLFQGHAAGGFL